MDKIVSGLILSGMREKSNKATYPIVYTNEDTMKQSFLIILPPTDDISECIFILSAKER